MKLTRVPPRTLRLLATLLLACVAAFPARAAEPAPPPDSRWKVHQTVPALYPRRLLQRGIKHGDVLVRVSILDTGKLNDVLVLYATEPDFGDEVLRVIKLWRFDPARIAGQAVGVVGHIKFQFEIDGIVAVDLRAGERMANFDDTYAYHAVELRQLDRMPTPTHVEEPVYPQAWIDQGIRGSATIEFYIDETGKVRTPAVMTATNDLLGGSAAGAVGGWTFDPPTRNRKPVLVRVEQTFKFEPPPKDAAGK